MYILIYKGANNILESDGKLNEDLVLWFEVCLTEADLTRVLNETLAFQRARFVLSRGEMKDIVGWGGRMPIESWPNDLVLIVEIGEIIVPTAEKQITKWKI